MNTKIKTCFYSLCCLLLFSASGTMASEVELFENVTTGSLRVVDDSASELQEFPLKHTEVEAEISGFVSRVNVTQTFTNPYDKPIEAVYVFPLPDSAAVDDMEMRIGERVIRAEIKKREEAKTTYERAKRQGKTASLLDQERPNIFTQSVANIMPGDEILITISYFETLKYEDGTYEFVFPMVVGPRYIPGEPSTKNPVETPDVETGQEYESDTTSTAPSEGYGFEHSGTGVSPDTNRVPDASRITPPTLKPDQRSGHDINVTVKLNAGLKVKNITSPSHEINIREGAGNTSDIELERFDRIANRDFVLRYDVAQEKPVFGILTHKKPGDDEGYFVLMIQPQDSPTTDEITPKEMIFLLDRSGSMSGRPIENVKKAMLHAIEFMNPNDSFNIISFANGVQLYSSKPISNSEKSREEALRHIARIRSDGGTNMTAGFKEALKVTEGKNGVRMILVMTDGDIGNENEVISLVQDEKNYNRIFMLGVDAASNRFLMDRVAEAGRGAVKYIIGNDDVEEKIAEFYEMFANPVLTNVEVDWGGIKTAEVFPERFPDLFAHQPLYLFGKYSGSGEQEITLKGVAGSQNYNMKIKVNFPETNENNASIAALWARNKIKSLMNEMGQGEVAKTVGEITEIALKYRLMTKYTSFVAVDETIRNTSGDTETIAQPVEMVEGKDYDALMGEPAPPSPSSHQNYQIGTSPPPSALPTIDSSTLYDRHSGGALISENDRPSNVAQNTNTRAAVLTIINYLLTFISLIAIILILWSGYLYVTAKADKDQQKKAGGLLKTAAKLIIAILIAWFATDFISSIFADQVG